jgi:putative MATE family efflux protein
MSEVGPDGVRPPASIQTAELELTSGEVVSEMTPPVEAMEAELPTLPGIESQRGKRELTTWTDWRELLPLASLLALPVMGTNLLQALITFTDTRMCSILGAPALAAMSVGRSGMFLTISVFMGIGNGVMAYVARLTGARAYREAREYATVGLLSGGVIGLILLGVGYLLGPGPVKALVASGAAEHQSALNIQAEDFAWRFMSVLYLGLIASGIQFAAINTFNALGRTAFPLRLLVVGNVLNLLGNWIFIPGPHTSELAASGSIGAMLVWPIAAAADFLRTALHVPVLGIAGSALSTIFTSFSTMCVAVMWLVRDRLVWTALREIPHPLRKAWDMLRVGLPVSAQLGLRSMSTLVLLKVLTWLPDSVAGQGALQVGIQIESLAFMPALAFGVAAATLVGQNLGAHRPQHARIAAQFCLLGNFVVMACMGLAIWHWPEFFVRAFIGDNVPEVVGPAMERLRIVALSLPALGAAQTLMGVLRGSGDTKITPLISLTAMYAVRIPLALLMAFSNLGGSGLGLGMGQDGIWWAWTISAFVEAALAGARFLSGRWQHVRLRTA